jgi:hypothetical protein
MRQTRLLGWRCEIPQSDGSTHLHSRGEDGSTLPRYGGRVLRFSPYARRQHECPTAQITVRLDGAYAVGYSASAPSASPARSKRLFHSGRRGILIRPRSIVTDAADGADGVMASAITYGRYPDCTRSQPALTAEDNLNPERVEEALCPPQPASECARTLGPARPVGADLQKVGGASRPLHSLGHDLAHKGRHWIDVDDVLDGVAPVVRISGFEGTRGAKCALAGCGPDREISHARQPLEANARQDVQESKKPRVIQSSSHSQTG